MDVVLDCSVALAWGLPDEGSAQADRLLGRTARGALFWVPALWWHEVANALLTARRRQRLSEPDRVRLVELYGSLPIQTDAPVGPELVRRLHALAEEQTLSAYDAAYLELAQRRDIPLATLDAGLRAAARRAGVAVVRI